VNDEEEDAPESPRLDLAGITTQWSRINDPAHFAVRYAAAVSNYLRVLLRDPHDADEATQDFLLKVSRDGFPRANPERGRFRDYLIAAVRNAAISLLRRRKRQPQSMEGLEDLVGAETRHAADQAYVSFWQKCILDRAWRELLAHERRSPGNLFHTVLRASVENPDEDSPTLAARVSSATGHALKPEALRKQLSRARKMFAQTLAEEVASTLDEPTAESLRDELSELGLFEYVAPHLES